MGLMDDLLDEEQSTKNNDDSDSGTPEQSKSLVANVYSTKRDDNYKNIADWGLTEEEIRIAHGVTAGRSGSGKVRGSLSELRSGGHEEWYAEFQLAMAHAISQYKHVPELAESDIEADGMNPVMDLLGVNADDIVAFLASRDDGGEMAEDVLETLQSAQSDETEGTPEAEEDSSEAEEGTSEQPADD